MWVCVKIGVVYKEYCCVVVFFYLEKKIDLFLWLFLSRDSYRNLKERGNCLHQRDYHRELETIIRIDQIPGEDTRWEKELIKVKLILFQNYQNSSETHAHKYWEYDNDVTFKQIDKETKKLTLNMCFSAWQMKIIQT